MLRALVKLGTGQTVHQTHHCTQRIICTVRIGRVALNARHGKPSRHTPAPPDLHHLAHLVGAGRLANKADIHALTHFLHMLKKRCCAVYGVALLIARNGEDHRTIRRCVLDKLDGSSGKGCNTRLHISRAAPPDHSVFFHRPERRHAPRGLVAHRHNIRVAIEAERLVRAPRPPARKKIAHLATVRTRALKARLGEQRFKQRECAALIRRYRSALYKRFRQLCRVYLRSHNFRLSPFRCTQHYISWLLRRRKQQTAVNLPRLCCDSALIT